MQRRGLPRTTHDLATSPRGARSASPASAVPSPAAETGDAEPLDDPFAVHLDGDADPASGDPDPDDPETIHAAAAHGLEAPVGPLPHRDKLEASFGRDLSGVRAHQGPAADAATAAMGATAYATGADIVLPAAPDVGLVAHEVAHVFQQSEGVQLAGGVGADGDPHEVEADEVADAVTRGDSVAARFAHVGGPGRAGVQRAVQRDKGKPAAAAPPAGNPAASGLTIEDEQKRRAMLAALPNVTARWRLTGSVLFATDNLKPSSALVPGFLATAYTLILAEDNHAEFEAVRMVAAGPGRDKFAEALEQARSMVARDRGRFDKITAAIDDLKRAGDLEHNATVLIANHALLSNQGKRAIASRSELGQGPLSEYLAGDCAAHGILSKQADLEARGIVSPYLESIAAAGQIDRRIACSKLVQMFKAGPPPEVGPKATPEPQVALDEAVKLKTVIIAQLGKVEPGGPPPMAALVEIDKALTAVSPRAKELIWIDPQVMGLITRVLDPTAAKLLLDKLDTVEALYQDLRPTVAVDLQLEKFKALPPATLNRKLAATNPAFPKLKTWLEARAGEANAGLRGRVLAHTKLKDDIIDRLPKDQNRLIYRLVVRGTATPTPEDAVHEAAEAGDGAAVVRGLQAMAGSNPARLAELERDPVFRASIERMTQPVSCDGVMLVPYRLALTMWGRSPSESIDPMVAAVTEGHLPGADDKPITADERLRLTRELFAPAIGDIADLVKGTSLKREYGNSSLLMNATHLQRAQGVLDRLRQFERKAADEPYLGWLRRERIAAGQELDKRFHQIHNIALRTWTYENGGPNIRSGAARVLGFEQGASVGEFNGEVVEVGKAEEGHLSIQQALRETKAVAAELGPMSLEWTLSEFASVESREVARGINDSDEQRVLSHWHSLRDAFASKHDELKRLTGVSIRPLDILRNAHLEHSGHLEARIDEKFSGDARGRIRAELGLGAGDVQHEQSPEDKAKTTYDTMADRLWAAHRELTADSNLAVYAALSTLRHVAMLLPHTDGSAPAMTDGDREEKPPVSFGGYYRQKYGISPRRHTIAVVRAMPEDDREVSLADAAVALAIPRDELEPDVLGKHRDLEALVIDEHNQHLVRGSFTVEVAQDRAKQIWRILHDSGRLEIINTQLYGDCNDEEQRLIRVAFRKLSGGIDLQFFIRQAIDAQRATAESVTYQLSRIAPLGSAYTNTDQQISIGADGDGMSGLLMGQVRVHGTANELEAALAVASTGAIDLNTRLRTAAANDNTDQVFRILEEATTAEKRAVLKDGALVNKLQRLGQWQWERCFKVLTDQADLADRLYSRSHGDGTWTESTIMGGGTHEAGMKEDIRGYIKKLRKKYDAEVRAEVVASGREGMPANIIDREITRRVLEGCGHLLAHKDVTAIMKGELDGDEYAEMRAILGSGGAGTEREWAVAAGGGKAAVMAEIKGMSPERRAARLQDPEYLRLLSQRLTGEADYRDALNALSATGDADQAYDGGALARLDKASRTSDQAEGADRDQRKTLRALSELTPTELRKIQHDPRLQQQVMAALDEDGRAIARRLLEAPEDPEVPADGKVDPKVAANAKADLLVRQAIGRLEVSVRGSWRDVLVQACEIYKLNLLAGFARHGEGGSNGEGALDDESPLSAAELAGKRAAIWAGVEAAVNGFAEIHRASPTRKTKDAITPDQMIVVVRDAVLAKADPTSALIAENIWTADEKIGSADPNAAKVAGAMGIAVDASVDEQGVKDALRSASDEHVIAHWTNVAQPGAEGGPTMQAAYREFAEADARAVPIVEARKQAAMAPPDPARVAAGAAPGGKTALPEGPAGASYATDSKQDDAVVRDARTKQRRFLEFAIKVSAELERMLLPFMGDDREASKEQVGDKTRGRGNKRYNALAEIILERVPALPPAGIGKAIGIQDQHAWLLFSGMRKAAAEVYLRDEQYLRYRGEQTGNGGVAQSEKEAYDQEKTLLGRAYAMAASDGKITAEEEAELEQRFESTDRASEEYQTAKQQAAAWAALIVGVLVTLVVTVLTGGVATGAVAMFAISAATAALSATAKALVMKEYLGDEYDSKDMSEAIAKEVITGIVAAGTTFYAQKILSAVGNATTMAKQANAMRQVLRTPPKLWQEIAHEAIEEAVSEGMTSVVEAGLAATDPSHWMHGYEEGAREAKAAAYARIASAPRDMLHGAVSSILTAGAGRVLRRKPSAADHHVAAKLGVSGAKRKRAVDLAANARQVFGDPGDKVLEALVQWGLEQAESDGPINWSQAPAELLRGVIEEFGEAGTEMHTSTAHKGNRRKRMEADLKRAAHLPEGQREAFRAMQDDAADTEAYVSLDAFLRARRQVVTAGLDGSLHRSKTTLTDEQREAFVAWAMEADSPEALAARAATDPRTLPTVMTAGTAAAPPPPRSHHAGAFPAAVDDATAAPPRAPAPPPPPAERPTVRVDAVPPPVSERPTVAMPAVSVDTATETPVSARPTEAMPAVSVETATDVATETPVSARPTEAMPAVSVDTAVEPSVDTEASARPTVTMPTVAPDVGDAGPTRDLRRDLSDVEHLSSLPDDVMGSHQQGAVEHALHGLTADGYQAFIAAHASVASPVGRGFLYKALAAGNDITSIQWLAAEIRGKDDAWLLDNLTLGDPRGVGVGLAQQWSMSCNAATTMVVRGNYDPVFALGLRRANPNISNFDAYNPGAYNADLAAREKALLESAYQGADVGNRGWGGIAAPRAAGESRGRWADDLLNAQSGATGLEFTPRRQIPTDTALGVLDDALGRGLQVPVVIGRNPNDNAHYVLATGRREGPGGPEYRFFNVASGLSKWVSLQQIQSGTMPLDGGQMIVSLEEPTAIGQAGVASTGQRGQGTGGPSTLTPADAPQLTHVAMAAVTQKMPAAVASQALSIQLHDEAAVAPSAPEAAASAPAVTEAAPTATAPTAAPSAPTLRLDLPTPVTQAVASLVEPAAHVAADTLATTPKPGVAQDPARAAFTALWKDGVIDVAAFRAKFDLEYEDAVAKIGRSMQSPELAAVLRDVPEEQLVAILLYTSTHYVEWNRTLRQADASSLPDVGEGIALADRGLSKLPVYEGWVYRGVDSLPAEVLANYRPGEVITEQAFTSTSNATGAQYQGNVQFKIKSRTGRDVAGLSRYDAEKEILFRPGTRFLVTDKERDGDTTIITLQEVESGPGAAPGGPGGPGGPDRDRGRPDPQPETTPTTESTPRGGHAETRAATTVDTDTEIAAEPAADTAVAAPSPRELRVALRKLAKLEARMAEDPSRSTSRLEKRREQVRAMLERVDTSDPTWRAAIDETLAAHPALRELLARELARLEQARANRQSIEASRPRREQERAALGVQGEQGRHGGVEVHSHFLGVVESEVFRDAYGGWYETLEAIDRLNATEDDKASKGGESARSLSHAVADGKIIQRGSAGDALRIARDAKAEIARREGELRAEAATAGVDPNDPALIARIAAMREEVARIACQTCLAASDETDFNSAYEIRDELIKDSLAGLAPTKGTEPEDQKQARENAAYFELAKETVRRLIDDGLLLTEQSNSIGKLQKRFRNGVLETAIASVINDVRGVDPKRAADLERNFSVRFLSMGLAKFYGHAERKTEKIGSPNAKTDAKANRIGWLVELVNQVGHDLALETVRLELNRLRAAESLDDDDRARVTELETYERELVHGAKVRGRETDFTKLGDAMVMRPDVVGIDTAGQELYEFTAEGKERFKLMYLALTRAARAKGEVLVFRPHVGEGAINPKKGEPWHAFRGRWERDGRPIHYDRARENLEAMIEVLEELHGQGLLDAEAVTIRFGHATHLDAQQAARLAALRESTGGALSVIAEVNLGSNSATNVVDQKGDDGERAAEEKFEDHSLLTLLYNDVQTILSTDGHAVEKTTMGAEYGRAYQVIEQFLAGRIKLRVTAEQAAGRGLPRKDGAVELEVGDLNQAELAKFLGAYAQLHQWAEQYRTTGQRGGSPLAGSERHVTPVKPSDLASTESSYKSPMIERARQERLARARLDHRAEQAGQQASDVASLGTALDDGSASAQARRDQIASEIERQTPDLRLERAIADGAQTVLSINVSGGGEFGVKTMNDKLVGREINDDIINARNEMLREVLSPPTFTIADQNYKSTTFATTLPDGPELQARLQVAMAEIDRRMKVILIAGLERGAKHHQAKDPVRAQLNADKAAELRGKDFSFNATVGATTVDGDSDALTAKMQASRAAMMARVEPSDDEGRDRRSGSYDEGAMLDMMGRAVDAARSHVGQTVTLDGVAVQAFRDEGGTVMPNLDVLRAFRKNRLDEKTHTPEGERAVLVALRRYVDAVNTFDFFKHTRGDEHDEGGAVDQRKAQARAMIEALRAGGEVDPGEVNRLLHTNAAGIEVAQQDTASEAAWYNAIREHGDRIVLNLDVRDLGLRVVAEQAKTMGKVVKGEVRGEALQRAALRSDDNVVKEKRKALADVRTAYLLTLERAIAETDDQKLRAELEAERSLPLLMEGDEFTVSIHPALRAYMPALVARLAKAAQARVAVMDAKSVDPESQRANQAAHSKAKDAGEDGHDRIKSVEAKVQALKLRVDQLREPHRERGLDALEGSGLMRLYASVEGEKSASTVTLRDGGTGAIVSAADVTQRLMDLEVAIAELEAQASR